MKTLLLLAASALALSACQSPATLKARLDCPQTQGSLTLVSAAGDGQSCIYREADGARIMKQAEITIRVDLARGGAEASVWTCDFSYDYVKINADYRS